MICSLTVEEKDIGRCGVVLVHKPALRRRPLKSRKAFSSQTDGLSEDERFSRGAYLK